MRVRPQLRSTSHGGTVRRSAADLAVTGTAITPSAAARLSRLQKHRENIRRCAEELGLDLDARTNRARGRANGSEVQIPSPPPAPTTSESLTPTSELQCDVSRAAVTPRSSYDGPQDLDEVMDAVAALRFHDPVSQVGRSAPETLVGITGSHAPDEVLSPSNARCSPVENERAWLGHCAQHDESRGGEDLGSGSLGVTSRSASGLSAGAHTVSPSLTNFGLPCVLPSSAGLPPPPSFSHPASASGTSAFVTHGHGEDVGDFGVSEERDCTFDGILNRWRKQVSDFQRAVVLPGDGLAEGTSVSSRSTGGSQGGNRGFVPPHIASGLHTAAMKPDSWPDGNVEDHLDSVIRQIKHDVGLDAGPFRIAPVNRTRSMLGPAGPSNPPHVISAVGHAPEFQMLAMGQDRDDYHCREDRGLNRPAGLEDQLPSFASFVAAELPTARGDYTDYKEVEPRDVHDFSMDAGHSYVQHTPDDELLRPSRSPVALPRAGDVEADISSSLDRGAAAGDVGVDEDSLSYNDDVALLDTSEAHRVADCSKPENRPCVGDLAAEGANFIDVTPQCADVANISTERTTDIASEVPSSQVALLARLAAMEAEILRLRQEQELERKEAARHREGQAVQSEDCTQHATVSLAACDTNIATQAPGSCPPSPPRPAERTLRTSLGLDARDHLQHSLALSSSVGSLFERTGDTASFQDRTGSLQAAVAAIAPSMASSGLRPNPAADAAREILAGAAHAEGSMASAAVVSAVVQTPPQPFAAMHTAASMALEGGPADESAGPAQPLSSAAQLPASPSVVRTLVSPATPAAQPPSSAAQPPPSPIVVRTLVSPATPAVPLTLAAAALATPEPIPTPKTSHSIAIGTADDELPSLGKLTQSDAATTAEKPHHLPATSAGPLPPAACAEVSTRSPPPHRPPLPKPLQPLAFGIDRHPQPLAFGADRAPLAQGHGVAWPRRSALASPTHTHFAGASPRLREPPPPPPQRYDSWFDQHVAAPPVALDEETQLMRTYEVYRQQQLDLVRSRGRT